MITIPYWWNRKLESLQSTINIIRPDILFNNNNNNIISDLTPIPLSPPISQNKNNNNNNNNNIEKQLMLSTNWDVTMDPTGWYVSIIK